MYKIDYGRNGVLIGCGLLLGIGAGPGRADLVFTLANPTATAVPGQTITFSGLLKNTGTAPLYLNTDFGIVDSPLTIDDTQFFLTWVSPTPQPTLPADNMTYTSDLFDVSLPSDPTVYAGLPTTFNGSFTLYGGSTPTDVTELGTQTFTVTLAVPEAGPMGSLTALLAMGGILLRSRRRRTVKSVCERFHWEVGKLPEASTQERKL